MKRYNRYLSLLLAFMIVISFMLTACGSDEEVSSSGMATRPVPTVVTSASETEDEENSEPGWTVMVYMCGADLESAGGFASGDLEEITLSQYSDDVNVVIQTGGAYSWNNDFVDSEVCERYVRTEDGYECAESLSDLDMSDPATLEDFLRWTIENYPAPHMALIFWNHGGGSISGVCFDERNGGSSLSLKDIECALENTSGLYPDGLEFVGYDACLMSTLENANMLAPYAKYMYASEELEPGTGWDYSTILTYLAENPDATGRSLASTQCESYYNYSQQDGYDPSITFSVVDLSKLGALNEAFDAVAKDLYESDDLAGVVRSVLKSDSFGSNNKSDGYTNMVDLGEILSNVSSYSSSADAAMDALRDCIVAQINGNQHKNAGGLSVYYPLSIQGTNEISIFTDLCKSAYYLAFVDKLAEGADLSASDEFFNSVNDSDTLTVSAVYLDDDGIYTVELEDMDNFAFASCSIFYEDSDGGYIYLGEDDDVIIDYDNYIITDNFDGSWLCMDGNYMPIELVASYDDISLYSCSILLNGEETNLRIMYDWNEGEFSVLGTWTGIDPNTNMAGRISNDLNEGDIINLVYLYFDEDGNESYFYGDDISYYEGIEVYYDQLPAADYDYSINLYDIYGNCYSLDYTIFAVEEDGSVSFYLDD